LLQKEAGAHFDPALVPLFVQQLPAMLAVRERFRDEPGTEAGAA
jgi:putative two-component system response regulator